MKKPARAENIASRVQSLYPRDTNITPCNSEMSHFKLVSAFPLLTTKKTCHITTKMHCIWIPIRCEILSETLKTRRTRFKVMHPSRGHTRETPITESKPGKSRFQLFRYHHNGSMSICEKHASETLSGILLNRGPCPLFTAFSDKGSCLF